MPDTVGRKPENEKARPGLMYVAAAGLFLLVFRKKPLLIDPPS